MGGFDLKMQTFWKRGWGQDLFVTGHFTESEIEELKREGYRKYIQRRNKNGIVIDMMRAV